MATKPAAPRTILQRALADIWQELLHVDQVDTDDNFFELGGDSIRAVRFANLLQVQFGETVVATSVFDAPTVDLMSKYLLRHYANAVARVWGATECPQAAQASGEERAVAASPAGITSAMVDETRKLWSSMYGNPDRIDGVDAANPPMIFVLSPPCSGSTLLRIMLAGHPHLFAPPELFLLPFDTLRERDAMSDKARGRLMDDGLIRALMRMRGLDAAQAKGMVAGWRARDVPTHHIYRFMQDEASGRTLVDKTPLNSALPETLRRAELRFEDALYVHLTRHPCGMIRSYERGHLDLLFPSPLSLSSRQLAEATWVINEQNILAFLRDVPIKRQCRISFEDLVRRPEAEMTALCNFLGIALHPDMLSPYANPEDKMVDPVLPGGRMMGSPRFQEHRGIGPTVADRWKEDLDDRDLGSVTWKVAESLGYRPLAQSLRRSRRAGPPRPPLVALPRRPDPPAKTLSAGELNS